MKQINLTTTAVKRNRQDTKKRQVRQEKRRAGVGVLVPGVLGDPWRLGGQRFDPVLSKLPS